MFLIELQKASFGGKVFIRNKKKAILDSGNTLVAFPSMYKIDFIDRLKKNGVDCKLEVENNP